SRPAGAAPSAHAFAERGDRRPHQRPHPARNPRSDCGAAMTRPTGRAVVVFAAGIPVALLVVILAPDLWWVALDYGALALVGIATDALLGFPPRVLNAKVALPDHLYIGERGSIGLTIAATRYRRPVSFDALAEQRGDLEAAEIISVELTPGQG